MVLNYKMTGLVFSVVAAILICSATAQLPNCNTGQEYFPHPTNCSLYYHCEGSNPTLQECPPGLWWNPTLNACDWPADSGCSMVTSSSTPSTSEQPPTESSTIDPSPSTETTGVPTESTSGPTDITSPTTTTPTTTTPTTTTPTTTPASSTTTEAPAPQTCPPVDDPENPIRIPHETRCDQYYLCINGSKVLHACTSDYQFSYTQRFCFPPNEAGCDSCPTVDTGATIRLPHETECHLYYLCVDTSPVLHQCAVADDEFSKVVRTCMAPEDAQCTVNI